MADRDRTTDDAPDEERIRGIGEEEDEDFEDSDDLDDSDEEDEQEGTF
jgi:hypothetical protein